MCIDFSQVDLAHIRQKITELATPSSPARPDPILGHPSYSQRVRQSFPIKHGYLIQDTIVHLAMAAPGWGGFKEFGVRTVNASGKTVTADFMDNVLYNKRLDCAIGLECKRVLSNRDRASENEIIRHGGVFLAHRSQVIRDCGLSSTALVEFVVMDAYGQPGESIPGLPTIHSSELHRIFGHCLQRAVFGFKRETLEIISKRVKAEEPGSDLDVVVDSEIQGLQDIESLTKLADPGDVDDADTCEQPSRDDIAKFLQSRTVPGPE